MRKALFLPCLVLGPVALSGCGWLSPPLDLEALTPPPAEAQATLPALPVAAPAELGAWVAVSATHPLTLNTPSPSLAATLGFAGLAPLLEQALAANPSLAAAQARLKQAEAQQRGALAQLFPTVGLNASLTRSRQAPGQLGPQAGSDVEERGTTTATASWPLDFFGRTFSGLKVAAGLAESSRSQLAAARLDLQQAVAQTYLALLAATQTERLWHQAIGDATEQNRLIQLRYAAGDLSLGEAQMALATLQGLRVQATDAARQRLALENRLNALLGQTPRALSWPEADLAALANPAWQTPPELSATVVLQRPDVQAATARLQAANAGIGLARAAFLPNFTLVAQGGFNTTALDELVNWSQRTWSVGPLLTLPLFQGGALRANLSRSWGVYEEAVAAYRGTVVGAYQALADAYATAAAAQANAASATAAATALARAATAQQQRYQAGDAAKADWLGSQILATQAAATAVQAQAANHAAAVAVLTALGGTVPRH